MKKVLLLAMAACVAAASWAGLPQKRHLPAANDGRFATAKVESFSDATIASSRAEKLSIDYSQAGDPYYGIGFNGQAPGDKIGMAFQMSLADVNEFAGNDVTAVTYYTGFNKTSERNQITKVTVTLTYDLQADPFYTQDFEITSSAPYEKQTLTLDTPYTIEEGKAFFVTVVQTVTSAVDYCVVIDYLYHGNDYSGGWVGYTENGSMVWDNIAEYYGFVCVGAVITGETLPTNKMTVVDMVASTQAYVNEPFEVYALLRNSAANDIENVEIKVTIGNNQPIVETYPFDEPLPYGETFVLGLDDATYDVASPDEVPVTVAITKVNGVENTASQSSLSTSIVIIPEGSGYKRNVVIEEMTGNWCGYCPLGITTMERIREEFPDGGLIPVAVHVNTNGATDPMTATSYQQVAALGGGGVPDALLNRSQEVYPGDYDEVITAYEEMSAVPALAQITLDVAPVEGQTKKKVLTATTEFVFDLNNADERYAIAFGVTEDGVGPYFQTNYYAGSDEDAFGWEDKPRSYQMYYNDVARQLNRFKGLPESIPAEVKAGQTYTFEYTMSLTNAISNFDHLNYIAYLINLQTGVIENADIVKTEWKSGIENVEADSSADAPVEFFNLQGMRVANPEGGIYIRRQGSSVSKVLVK